MFQSSDPASSKLVLPASSGDAASRRTGGDGYRSEVALPSWEPISVVDENEPKPSADASTLPARAVPERSVPVATAPPLFPEPPGRSEARWALYDRLDLLKRGRRHIALAVGGVFLMVLLVTAMMPRQFEAYTILLISERQPVLDAATEYAAVPGLEERRLLNQALIMQQSPEIAERTAQRLVDSGRPLALVNELGDPTTEELARHLQSSVVSVAQEGDQIDAVRITARTSSPEEAAQIAAIYTEEYMARTRETSRQALTNARSFLEDQLQARQEELARVEERIQDFERRTGSVDIPQQASARIGQVAQLEVALDRARIEQQLRGASLRSLESEIAELQPRLRERMASGTEQELQRVNERIAQLDGMVEDIYRRNPNLRGAADPGTTLGQYERQLAELRAQREELGERYVDEVMAAGGIDLTNTHRGGDYLTQLRRRIGEERVAEAGARAEISALEQRLSSANAALGSVPGQAMTLLQLRRQQEAAERMVLYLAERAEQAGIAEETDFGLAQMIRPATIPSSPSSPRMVMNLLLALVLGLGIGLVVAGFRHRLDGRIYAPRDLHSRGLSVIGVLPPVQAEAGLVVQSSPRAPESEAFRHLHARLRRGPGGPRPQAVMIAGAERGAGASVVSANLAAAAAQSGLRTLVVDADIHHPCLRQRMALVDEVGAGQNQSPLVYWTTGIDNLFALTPREKAGGNDLFWSQGNVRELLVRVRSAFDLIIFDAPPTLLAADSAVIASQADAVLLVARAGQTHGDALLQAASELHDVGGEIIGAVLTGFHPDLAHGYEHTFGYRHRQPALANE